MHVRDSEKTVMQPFPKFIGDTDQPMFPDHMLAEIIVNIVENERKDNPKPRLCAEFQDHPKNQSITVLYAQGHERLLSQMLLLMTEKMNENEVLFDKVSTGLPESNMNKWWIGTRVKKVYLFCN